MEFSMNVKKVREITDDVEGKDLSVKHQLVLENKDGTVKMTVERPNRFDGIYKGQNLNVNMKTTQKSVGAFTEPAEKAAKKNLKKAAKKFVKSLPKGKTTIESNGKKVVVVK